jgi:head-tail adaptor
VSVGQLGDRVTFQRRVVTNVGGVGQEDWPALPAARYPAHVRTNQGNQEVVIDGNAQTQTSRRYAVRVRYRGDVTTDDRALFHHPTGDRILQLLSVAESDDGRWLDIDAIEVRA